MRILILLFMLSFSNSLLANNLEWKFTDNYNGDRFSNSCRISALDTNSYIVAETVYSAQTMRFIKRTTNYGQTWDTLYYSVIDNSFPSPNHFSFTDINYIDENNIIALFGYYNFLRSTDGGQTWEDSTCVDSFPYSQVEHLDSCIFLSGASGTHIAISRDLGTTWDLEEINYPIDSISYYDNIFISSIKSHQNTLYMQVFFRKKLPILNTLGYITHNLLMMSTDYGKSWEKLFFNNESVASPVFDIDEKYLYTQYTDYTFDTVLVNSPDGNGIDTAHIATPHSQLVKIDKFSGKYETVADSLSMPLSDIIDISIFDNSITVSTMFKSFISTDNGISWFEEMRQTPKPNYSTFNCLSRPTLNKGLAVGLNCFATLHPTTSVTEKINTLQNISVYPNPVTVGSKINLEFDAKEAGIYSYQLCSVEGRIIDIETRSFFPSGKASVSLELSSELAKGVYILSILESGNIIAAQKIIVE